jgi:hypothetical protein
MRQEAWAIALVAACSGTSGVREHAEVHAVDEHCGRHGCPTRPEARHLGDGCYVVEERVYQCSTDERPLGRVSCLEVQTDCPGLCYVVTTDHLGQEIPTERCRELGLQDRRARRGPTRCKPARVLVVEAPTAELPWRRLALPSAVVLEVTRSGKERVTYAAEVCAPEGVVVVGETTTSTGFADLDRALDDKLTELSMPPGTCETVSLIVVDFECEVEQFAL